jgi:prevent-host-death family protein
MKTVNIHEAKTHLSRLIEEAGAGEPFVIAKAGKPKVKVVAIEEKPVRRIGFMKHLNVKVPDDFNSMFAEHIADMSEAKAEDRSGAVAQGKQRKLGTLRGKFVVPADIDTPFAADIEEMFNGTEKPLKQE